jgi:hypothetical protein
METLREEVKLREKKNSGRKRERVIPEREKVLKTKRMNWVQRGGGVAENESCKQGREKKRRRVGAEVGDCERGTLERKTYSRRQT